jgi:hypothetical protein
MLKKSLSPILLAAMGVSGLIMPGCVVREYQAPPPQPAPAPPPAGAEVDVETAPPADQPDVVVGVAPGPDYLWVGGYWGWSGGAWVWYHGYWGHRPWHGAMWVRGGWYRGPGGRYHYGAGHWR